MTEPTTERRAAFDALLAAAEAGDGRNPAPTPAEPFAVGTFVELPARARSQLANARGRGLARAYRVEQYDPADQTYLLAPCAVAEVWTPSPVATESDWFDADLVAALDTDVMSAAWHAKFLRGASA